MKGCIDLPPLGAFLRPVGLLRFGYCLRVMQQFRPDDARPGIEYERWGMQDRVPFDDGHVRRGYFIDLAPTLIPGVWRYPPDQPNEGNRDGYRYSTPSQQLWETYYRLIPFDADGQMDLFA